MNFIPRTSLSAAARTALAAVCGILVATASAPAQTVYTGTLPGNTTWTGSVIVQGTLTVPAGIELTIDPGTTVLMRSAAMLVISGRLMADGTAAAPIHFTRESAGIRWRQIRFTAGPPSRFRHCIIEFANCEGSHLDYYDTDCNPATTPPARTYHEAIVAVATHLDIDQCTFRNLPDSTGSREGDALAIISDDPVVPGQASAHISQCQFLSIGQGIHSRFSYLLIEDSFFTDHHGDNDDIDMYGESSPPPLVRNNVFDSPGHDDMINPTRCSAIIVGNVVFGGDDHGIVLRDRCFPVVMNNLIYNCAAGGISVQNQCDALLINNTIVNCGRGVRLFDHTDRWNPPYCLSPGSGRATLINCVIRDCPDTLTLTDSTYPNDRGSHVTVIHCNIQGGQAGADVSANSTLTWGVGNIDADPLFLSGSDRHLQAGSPCIDAGVDPATVTTNPAAAVTNDLEGLARPLDGDGDGTARFDMGAYEFLLASADSNGDGIPDGWLHEHGINPIDDDAGAANPDQDAFSTLEEWLADTDPTDPASFFRILQSAPGPPASIEVTSSSARRYSLWESDDLTSWSVVAGQSAIPGLDGPLTLTESAPDSRKYFRVTVALP